MWLKIQNDDVEVRLSWGDGNGPYPFTYRVGTSTVRIAGKKLRAKLYRLSEWFRNPLSAELPTLLRDIASAGSDLRTVLFDCPQHEAEIEELEVWIAEKFESGDKALSITADPTLHIPWGLVFEGTPASTAGNTGTIAAFDGFWSLRYHLSIVLSGCDAPNVKVSRPRESFRLLSLLNRAEYDYTCDDLGSDLFAELETLLSHPVGRAFNIEACNNLIKQVSQKDTIFHFFGHHKEDYLDLGDDEKIDLLKFKMMLKELTSRVGGERVSCSLLFLNACESAVGDSDYSLRYAAARPGLCGLIATETLVPRQFASKFGLKFLQSMIIAGSSVAETMAMLRRDPDLWPMTLLYGCYAHPDYRILLS